MPRKRKPYIPKALLDLDLKDDVKTIDIQSLYTILSYMRVSGGTAEKALIDKFILPTGALADSYGNYHLNLKREDGSNSEVLWSAHTDSVHTEDGQQKLFLTTTGIVGLADKQPKSNCLGADDGSGVWLLLEMIKVKVPGYYLFHRDEETGRKGSQWIVEHMEEESLSRFKYAIAFDRKGLDSVITKQSSRKCCSQEFVDSIVALFPSLTLKADPTGSYTDTYSYREVIAECTNISVGYTGAHSHNEVQDVKHLLRLRNDLIHVFDESKLVIARDPKEKDPVTNFRSGWYESDDYGGYEGGYYSGGYHGASTYQGYGTQALSNEILLGRIVSNYPYKVGALLAGMGYDAESLLEELYPEEKKKDNVIQIGSKKLDYEQIQKEMDEEAAEALRQLREMPIEDPEDAMTNEGSPPKRIHEEPVDSLCT